MARIENGRIVGEIPDSGMFGGDIVRGMNPGRGRRAVMIKGTNVETINPSKNYSKSELISRKTGKPIKTRTMPDRTKGANTQTYGGQRDRKSKQIIHEQIVDVAEKFYRNKAIEFDDDDYNWMVFEGYILPPRWSGIATESQLLISFPMEYPRLPPVGFYLKSSLPGSPDGHLHSSQYDHAHAIADPAPIAKDWHWYCVYIEPGDWKPAPYSRPGDWKRGDSLWEYNLMIGEALRGDD